MTDAPLPENFRWVSARAICSPPQLFKQLYNEVISDVEERNSIPSGDNQVKFTVTAGKGNFSVVREIYGSIPDSVDFAISRSGTIMVQDDDKTFQITATLTLNNDGKCRLKVADDELSLWQFRRMALEKLFFVMRNS